VTVSVDFKMRKGPLSTAIVDLSNRDDAIQYDLELSENDLKNGLLAGTYFPIDLKGISIGNIGSSVTGDQLLGVQFRRQSDMKTFEITSTASPDLFCEEI